MVLLSLFRLPIRSGVLGALECIPYAWHLTYHLEGLRGELASLVGKNRVGYTVLENFVVG